MEYVMYLLFGTLAFWLTVTAIKYKIDCEVEKMEKYILAWAKATEENLKEHFKVPGMEEIEGKFSFLENLIEMGFNQQRARLDKLEETRQ